jgi:hypothetical protein
MSYPASVFGMNFFVFSILMLAVILYFSKSVRDEGFFGMSPGVMDQLASTRVESNQELAVEDKIYNDLTRQGIINMMETGYGDSDFGASVANY